MVRTHPPFVVREGLYINFLSGDFEIPFFPLLVYLGLDGEYTLVFPGAVQIQRFFLLAFLSILGLLKILVHPSVSICNPHDFWSACGNIDLL